MIKLSAFFFNMYPVINFQKYYLKKNEYIQVLFPNIVPNYNNHMKGVDLYEQFISYYKNDRSIKKISFTACVLSNLNGGVVQLTSLRKVKKRIDYFIIY